MSVTGQYQATPTCPLCSELMKKRAGKNGDFWGCSKYPACRGTRNINVDSAVMHKTDFEPLVKMPGSYEQEAIWECMTKGTENMVVNAGPGTGKTFSAIQGCLRLPRTHRILFVAFNKHIAKEANGKLAASGCSNVKASTFHSLGYAILRKQFTKVKANDNKMAEIFEAMSPEPSFNKAGWRRTLNLAEKLASFVKNYNIDYKKSDFTSRMEALADHHGLEFVTSQQVGMGVSQLANISEALDMVPIALNECRKRASMTIDYDDMLWLPILLEMPFDPVDMIIVDEAQDLNLLQHSMALRAGYAGRAVIVGDRHQAIYGWRGAATDSMEVLTEELRKNRLGVKEFPLTITRRCPKLHVQMAQYLYPEIQALEDAPLGEILPMKPDQAVENMKLGDMVICRINKELISTAYKLIRRGVRPAIKGRDIGKGLLSLLETLYKQSVTQTIKQFYGGNEGTTLGPGAITPDMLMTQLNTYRYEQESRLLPQGKKAEGRIEALHEKCDCLSEFISNSLSIEEMREQITRLFSDDENQANVVTMGTIHRTKGLESERVFILAPELIPHPMAKKDWQHAQEKNIAWIAITRSKFDNKTGAPGTIVFCGQIPPIYNGAVITTEATGEKEVQQ